MKDKGGFKNVKLGKNVYRQLKRRGPPNPVPARWRGPKPEKPNKLPNAKPAGPEIN